jgi:hypothetical protein
MAASSKKKAPAAKPVARRFKVAVPERMTIAFDKSGKSTVSHLSRMVGAAKTYLRKATRALLTTA